MQKKEEENAKPRLLDDIGRVFPELKPELAKLQAPSPGPYEPGELFPWLCGITTTVFRIVLRIGNRLFQTVLDEHLQGLDRPDSSGARICPCAKCGSIVWSYNGRQTRSKTFRSIFGDVLLERYQARCSRCHGTFYPLDCILGLSASVKLLPVLQELVVFVGTRLHFRDAAAVLEKTLGIQLSRDTIHKAVGLLGEAVAKRQEHADWSPEIEVLEEATKDVDGPCTVEVAVDGAMVPMNEKPKGEPNSHQEARSMSLRVKNQAGDLLAKLIISRLVPLECFLISISSLLDECRELGLTKIILTGDGAKWIWRFAERCSIVRTVLDWYHLRQYITALVEASGGGRGAGRRRRLDRIENALWNGRVDEAIGEIDKYRARNASEREARRDLRRYVKNNRKHIINYQWNWSRYKIVGSGAIEGGQRKSIHDRMKCAGMRWSKDGADRMMSARCAQLNGTATKDVRGANVAA